MTRKLEIVNKTEVVTHVLSSLKNDNHLVKTFDGTAKDGVLKGFYTNMAILNGVVIGYVKIIGEYNRKEGNLKLYVIPSNLYWIVMTFSLIIVFFLTFKGLIENDTLLIGAAILSFLAALAWTIIYVLESHSFIKHMDRVIKM